MEAGQRKRKAHGRKVKREVDKGEPGDSQEADSFP